MDKKFSVGIINLDIFEIFYYSIFDVFSYNYENVKLLNYKEALSLYRKLKKYLSNIKKYQNELENLEFNIKELLKNDSVELVIFNEDKDKAALSKIINLKK